MTTQASVSAAVDVAAAEAFGERMVEVLNNGALSLMLSLGHRSGLFDTMAGLGPATSAGVADAAGLQERYVREWLSAMTVGGIVAHDPATGLFQLPAAHATCLTRAAGADNIAVFAQYIAQLGQVEDDVLDCFRNGGGVSYDRYRRFHEIMAEDSGVSVLPALREHILPLVSGLHERLEQGIDVLDVGCGRGRAITLLAEWYPRSRFTGYDLSEEAVAFARRQVADKGLDNIAFEVRDATTLDKDVNEGAFDLVFTFDAIHDQAAPLNVLKGIRRALRDDGVYIAQDIKGHSHLHMNMDHPLGPLLYTVSCMHCMTVSLAQGGEGLGTLWGREKAVEYFDAAGFGDVEVNELPHDIQNYWYVCRP